jgi:RNA-directed DNA polymerase
MSRSRGRSLEQMTQELKSYVLGWKAYFRLAQTPGEMGALDKWIRHRRRAVQLKQWKRGITMFRELRKLGASVDQAAIVAGGARRWWRTSGGVANLVLTGGALRPPGSPEVLLTSTSRTARCGPACRVVWEGLGQAI